MKTKFISAISAIALAAAVMGPVQAQDQGAGAAAPAETGTEAGAEGGINQDALSREQVQMVREHCAALLAEHEGQTGVGAAADAAVAGDPAQPAPTATDSLANNPPTEAELNDPTGTATAVEDGDMDAAADADAAAQTETTTEGQTAADAEIVGNAAVPADSEAEPFDLDAITVEDCIQAGIVG